jgi:hypothetical protein
VTSEQTKTFRFKCHLGFPFCVGKNAYGLVISLPLTTLRSSPNFREHDSTLNDTRAVCSLTRAVAGSLSVPVRSPAAPLADPSIGAAGLVIDWTCGPRRVRWLPGAGALMSPAGERMSHFARNRIAACAPAMVTKPSQGQGVR